MPASEPATHHCPTCGAVLDTRDAGGLCVACLLGEALEPGEPGRGLGSIGGHELIEVIARGGMGIVYRARQSDPAREVALKALPGAELMSEEARQRFRIEAQAMARLQHPAIVPIYELGEEDGTPFFTMKFAAGGCLAQRIDEFKGRWRESAELIATIAEAVQYAHERGVLHRDLKPGNVLFDEDGHAMVSDFGLAKILDEEADLTRTIALMGTPNYMAPELTRGGKDAVTTACDVWSLGVMLYELLAGQQPFRGDNLATILRQLNEEEPEMLPREVPRDLAIIAGKALQKTPARRYASAQELADDLRLWLAGEAIMARSQPVAERCWRWLRRHPVWAAAALLVVGGVALIVWRNALLTQMNLQMEARNHALSQGLADALIEQAAAQLGSTELNRREKLTPLLTEAARLTPVPSVRARSVAASMLSLLQIERVGSRIKYRDLISNGETAIPTADLKRRLDYRNIGSNKQRRLIRLVAFDASVDSPETLWQREMEGPSSLVADLSDDGRWVVFANGSSAELWDTQQNVLLRKVDDVHIGLMDLHPTQPLFTWVDGDRNLWAWHFQGGEMQRLGRPLATSRKFFIHSIQEDGNSGSAHTTVPSVKALTLSPSGEEIAVTNGPVVEIWNVAKRAVTSSFTTAGAGQHLHWSERSGLLIPHQTLPQIDVVRDGKVTSQFRWSAGACMRIVTFPGSWKALCVSSESVARVWDMRNARELMFLGAGGDALCAGADGATFSVTWTDSTMLLYRMVFGPVFREYDCPFLPDSRSHPTLLPSSDGRLLATVAGGRILLWDMHRHQLITALEPEPDTGSASAWFDVRGGAIFTGNSLGAGIRRHTLTWKGDRLDVGPPTLAPGTQGWQIQQADATCSRFVLHKTKQTALWEGDGTSPVRQLKQIKHSGTYQHLSPRLTYGHSSNSKRILPLYEGVSDKAIQKLDLGAWAGHALFSMDEQWMIASSRDAFRVLSTEDWRVRFKVNCLVNGNEFGLHAFRPDGKLVALEHHTDTFGLFTVPEGTHIIDLHAPTHGDIREISFSPDGKKLLILSSSHRLCEWDLAALQTELVKMGLSW